MIILGTNSIKDTGFNVANSCRFDGTSAYLHKSTSSGTNTKFTFSAWIKRASSGSQYPRILGSHTDASNYLRLNWNRAVDGEQLHLYSDGVGTLLTNRFFRDPTAWMHILVVVDTTDGTADDRQKIFINGVQETSFATRTNPSQNADYNINNASSTLTVGKKSFPDEASDFFDGYMAEVHYIDGTAYATSDFGEYDEDSPQIWKPKKVSGITYGTNGFYLDFKDSSNLGNDANGGTDLTEVNLAATDQATDTCTNNFATGNPLDNYYNASTFSEGNCQIVTGGSTYSWNTGTIGLSAGKWYWETELDAESSGGSALFGIADRPTVSATEELGGLATTHAYLSSGNFRTNNTNTSNSVSATTGDIIGIALNLDDNEISYYKNNTLIVAAQSITATGTGFYFPAWGDWLDPGTVTFKCNFGNPPYANSSDAADANGYGAFEYAPPTGYLAICTKNLGSDGG